MSQRQVPGPSKGRGSGKNVSAAVRSSSRRRGGGGSSSRRSDRPELPVSSSGRVLATNSAVLEWMTRSSTSSQVTSDTPSQESVGTSDTTLSWHGPANSSVPPPVLNLPLSFGVPSARELLYAVGSEPLFSEDELREDSQQLHNSQDLDRSAASPSRRESSDDETRVGADVRGAAMRLVEDDDDDDVADRTWEPGEQRASSSSSGDDDPLRKLRMAQRLSQQGPSVAVSQQGGSSVRSGAKRARGRPSATQEPTCPETPSVGGVHTFSGRQSARGGGGKMPFSAVWEFFIKSPEDISVAMCRICMQKVKRGQGANVGTTALRQHMERHHKVAWENRGKNVVVQPEASPSGPQPFCSSQGSTTSAEGSCVSFPTSTGPAAPPPTPSKSFRQQSITEAIEKRQQYACTHPTAQKLNVLLAKLLVLQSLPFHVVDSDPFRELMACAEPRWRVPSRHFFSKKAIPALHTYVEQKVGQSLSLSVCGKVHASADVWSCNYGQGQYMSFTAHWVNVVPAQSHQPLCQVTAMPPPRSPAAFRAPMSSSASSSSTLSSASTAGTSRSGPPAYHLCRAQRCHAVLHLVCLGERSHTGEELLRVIREEIDSWLSPRKLKIGTMVTDNGTNIVSALRQGGLSHAPCMAHVFNLVVKRFLKSSTQLHDMLKMARKLCMHFSHSYTAKHALLELQRQNAIPQHRLICDVSTRWNSTLHMLDRLYEQRKAVNDFLMMQADRSTPLCNFDVSQWQLMRDTCRLLRPFEEATLFVSRQDYAVNDVIPLLHVVEQMLLSMSGQGTGDVAPTCHGHLSPGGTELEEDEDEEEDINAQEMYPEMGDLSGQVTGEEQEVDEEEQADDPDTPWQYAVEMEAGSPSESLAQMARCMLSCLRSDSRIITIRQRDDYWLSTMLDPRYRSKMGAFFPPAERDDKLTYFRDILCNKLVAAYVRHRPSSRTSDSGGPLRSRSTAMTARRGVGASSSTSSTSSTFSLESLMTTFLHPPTEETSQHQDMEQTLHQQVVAYLECTLQPQIQDPLDYWAAKLDLWPQLAEFALEKLSCPASSVASERVFSAAGGIVTQKRTRLSTKNVERLTFVKMNQEWISKDFHTPVPDASD